MSKSSKDYVYDNIDVFDHVPEYLRNKLNSSFSRNLFNKFLTKEESIPVYGIIGNKSVNDTDTRPLLAQDTLEHKINSLIPLIYAKTGSEENVLAFSDVINKAKLLGIDVAEFADWGACQAFNFVPPIDIDKFINFSSYFWAGSLSGSEFAPAWNADLEPEYYVIAKPKANDQNKFPAEIATSSNIILTGSGHKNEKWIITFTSPTAFSVLGEDSGLAGNGSVDTIYGGLNNGSSSNPYLTFKISAGSVPFVAGDKFEILTYDLTEQYSFTYTGTGNGGLSGVRGATAYQKVDGIQTYEGQRILVKNQNDPAENGVYIVSAGTWSRAPDCDGTNVVNGIKIYVSQGPNAGLYASTIYTDTHKYFTPVLATGRNVSEWTEYNFWFHRDDAESLGIDINKTIQAKRPIIEYDFGLELNTDVVDGKPVGGNVLFNAVQSKIRFNQLPLFNLYVANGESAELVSPLFYYEEDASSNVDAFMKRRIKLNENNDYIFSQGCVSDSGMLFFKKNGVIESIWTAGAIDGERPRYVAGETLQTAVDVPFDAEMQDGVWTTPFQLEYNTYHENRKSVIFGDLINHFRSIISKQTGFVGSSFGRNNFRTIENKNLGLGGKIKEHNGAFAKFVGLVNQENISPLSVIDFGETQYAQAINSVGEYVNKFAIDFLSTHGTPLYNGDVETTAKVKTLVDEYCSYYGDRVDVDSYLSTSTSAIPNWPATLPVLGLSTATEPSFGFDNDLGINIIVHHDGHFSPKNQRNVEFDRGLTKQVVTRSDGTQSAGVFSSTTPVKPYKNQLWFNSTSGVLKIYDIASDSTAPEFPNAGDFWYDRTSDVLYQWENLQWVVKNKQLPWVTVETDKIINSFIMEIETRIFNSIHPNQKIVWDKTQYLTEDALKFEFAKYCAKYGMDPYAPDFLPEDPFTWNYKQADFPVIGTGFSRWHEAYKAYFAQATGTAFTTCRPNIEPWKLMGYDTKPAGFDATYAGTVYVDPNYQLMTASVVLIGGIASLNSCPNVVDGKTLEVGERVVVTTGPNVGVYLVNSVGTGNDGVWSYAADFNPMSATTGTHLYVRNGAYWNSTWWSLMNVGAGVEFQQVRQWKIDLWSDIQNAFPTLKLCVNVFNEQLLPPYVDPLSVAAQFALTNTATAGIANAYGFGDSGPAETVWKKSLEHSYSLLRVGLKNQPLKFIEATWGDVYRIVNSLKLDKQVGKKLSHKEYVLHGENIPAKNRARIIYSSLLLTDGSGEKSVELVCDYVTDEEDFFKVKIDGVLVGRLKQIQTQGGFVGGIDFSAFSMTDAGLGFEIGDSIAFTVAATGEISNVVFTSASVKTFIGIAQWYTQLMKFNSYSLTESRNNTFFRKWDVKLGYRFGAFMNTDTLHMSSAAFDIPVGICKLLTKVSPYSGSTWINAIRIQLVQIGSTNLEDGIYKPKNFGEDWTFRIETYFNKHPEISYYEVDAAGEYLTFNALEKRRSAETWLNHTKNLSVKTSTTPMLITGIQNVVDFLFGYTRYLEDSGWRINNNEVPDIDAETGRLITWQLEIEKFIDAAYDNMAAGDGVIIDPFLKNVWFESPKGLVSKFETVNFLDVAASQFAFDVLGNQIPVDQLKIIREEDLTTIISDTPMFGAHVNVEHYAHAVLFPYYLDNAKKQKLIYDPFLGLKIKKILVQGSRQAVQSARPSFGGFYLNGNQMNRNIVASIDDLGKLYDAETVFENPTISKYALALFGFSNKDYFTELGTSKKNQFNFWRGMIQAKGTNASIDAFLNNEVYQDAKIDEYWAFKIAEYGDARIKSFPELKLSATDSLLDTTRFQFADGTSAALPGFTQISATDENRWINLDDLNELSNRGMYFDTISMGKIIIKEKPQISNLVMHGNGRVKFVHGYQVVKTFMSPDTITVRFSDSDNFRVYNSANQFLGAGVIGVTFADSNGDFEFRVETNIIDNSNGDYFTFQISEDINSIVKLPFISDKIVISDTVNTSILSQNVVAVFKANISITVEGFGPQKPKFSPLKFFDYQSDTFIGNVPFWHPAVGQHTPDAFEIINMVSPADPARYNQTTQTLNNPNYDMLKPWGSKEVGKVWWNTKRLDYIPYYDPAFYPNIEHRLSKWGSTAEYSSVEVYEWVESDVPPYEYNAKVLSDAKDTTIPQDEKKSGEAAISKLLSRSRTWNVRPIAWKKNEAAADSPFFTSALFSKLFITGRSVGTSTAILNTGRFADYSIETGMSLSAWDFINNVPVGQATINSALDYVIGGEYIYFPTSSTSMLVQPSVIVNGVTYQLTLSVDKSNKLSSIGQALGSIKVLPVYQDGIYYIQATEVATGKTQRLSARDTAFGQIGYLEYDFTEMGIKLRLSSPSPITITASQVANAVGHVDHDIFIRESIEIEIEIDFPGDSPVILVNDQTDSDSFTHPYGWRTWVNPTQTDLDADLKSPDNLWEPVYGAYVPVDILTVEYLKKIKDYQENKLVLNSGETVEKFQAVWSEYTQLNDIFIEAIYDGENLSNVFSIPTSDKSLVKSRLFIYIDGVLQPETVATVSKLDVTLNLSPMSIGSKIVIIYKRYSPSTEELSFDPDVADDILSNTQFKFGYDYTVFSLRDSNDKLSQSIYYFWVKNKNTAPKSRKMSILQARNLLTDGPSLYMTFHNPLEANGSLPVRYDSVAIFGLNKFANRDDTYKLRFTRNFTLRDDPNELDLKNVHAEWTLLRPAQNTRIPLVLWDKLVDSAVGKDAIGNTVPYTYLSDYDAQHGTSNRFGLATGQILAEKENVLASIKHTILNTTVTMNLGGTSVPDYIQNLKLSQLDKYFDTPENIRKTLDFIWREAKPKQINEIFFAVINDALANNFEFKDVFKTSRLSVYSIKTVGQILTGTNDE